MKNEIYFKKRFLRQERAIHKTVATQQRLIKEIYTQCYKELETQLATFLKRYTYANNLTIADTKKMLNTDELARFRYSIKGYLQEMDKLSIEQAAQLKKELDILAGRTRVARIKELQTAIQVQLCKSAAKAEKTIKLQLESTVGYTYQDTKEILKSNTLAKLDHKAIQTIVDMDWNRSNYSKRLWANTSNLGQKLMKNVTTGIVQGNDYKQMTKRLMQDTQQGYFECRRILHTETSYAMEKAKEKVFKDTGIKQYKIVATLDKSTSEICKRMNGAIFSVKDKIIGVNCPPLHPFCRSVSVPIVE